LPSLLSIAVRLVTLVCVGWAGTSWNLKPERMGGHTSTGLDTHTGTGDTSTLTMQQTQDTLLHLAAKNDRTGWIEMLLTQGADIERRGDKEMTPLASAALHNRPLAILALAEFGANLHPVDFEGMTPVHRCIELGLHEALAALCLAETYQRICSGEALEGQDDVTSVEHAPALLRRQELGAIIYEFMVKCKRLRESATQAGESFKSQILQTLTGAKTDDSNATTASQTESKQASTASSEAKLALVTSPEAELKVIASSNLSDSSIDHTRRHPTSTPDEESELMQEPSLYDEFVLNELEPESEEGDQASAGDESQTRADFICPGTAWGPRVLKKPPEFVVAVPLAVPLNVTQVVAGVDESSIAGDQTIADEVENTSRCSGVCTCGRGQGTVAPPAHQPRISEAELTSISPILAKVVFVSKGATLRIPTCRARREEDHTSESQSSSFDSSSNSDPDSDSGSETT